ncbi:hypothetical protein ACSI5N_25180 (plasmid) [Raoultella ornithinolytica]|uniref:hypothetical protein n=1 Tax=Raoultella ornithinolytica TaxID=54291 RepID=UPI00292AAFBA|nr:hypothetical protein [Raoultella ornithinolytica]MDV1094920.1 hypothetical protein [Raoultella ornithinolytica]MDV1122736.1 hypothetical protein [Raoultella ornithinolytica]MDV1893251.1 hypothetical protein [Raoultella ornithinolytica]
MKNDSFTGVLATFAPQPPLPFTFVMNGNDYKPVGKITIANGEISFEGNADESAKAFINALVKQWSPQWKAAQKRIAELEAQLGEQA